MFTPPHRSRTLARAIAIGLALGVGLLASPSPARAGCIAHRPPEKVLAQADVIFQGTVVATASGWTDQRQVMATTEYTIQVERVLLDRDGWLAARTRAGATILSFMGGVQHGVRYHVSGMPTLGVGESAFYFMSAEDLRNNAMSPVIGVSEGLYRVGAVNGERRVFTPGGCAGASRPVDFRFFSKFRDANATYTPDEFAAEILRALPIAAENPELRRTQQDVAVPAHLAGSVFSGDGRACAVGTLEPATLAGADRAVIPDPPARSLRRPDSLERWFAETVAEAVEPTSQPEWGQFDNEPDYPIVMNVPPGTWWRDTFLGAQAYWNVYASGVFRFFANSNNLVGWPNGRFECGFLTGGQLNDLYGRAWNTGEIGVCWSRTGPFSDRIIEADIAFRAESVFSNDPLVTYADGNVNSFQTVALHELGHVFGRSHSWDSDPNSIYPSVMNYFTNGYYQAEAYRVFADDSASIRGAFVPQEVSLTDIGVKLWRMSGMRTGTAPFPNAVTGLTLDSSVLQGNTFFVSNVWVENIGTITRASTIDWYLDPTPHDNNLTGAYYCGSSSAGSLSRGTGTVVHAYPRAPNSIPPGNYYLCASIAEVDAFEANDVAWSQNTIRVDANPAFGPPVNDTPAGATVIGVGTFTGTTQFATADGEASCGSSNGSPSVWFRFAVPPEAGRLEVNTCGSSFDTVLSLQVRSFNPQTGFFSWQEVACNDDAFSGPCSGSLQSLAATDYFPALGTENVRVRLAGFAGASGNYVLNVRLVPANEACPGATIISTGTHFGTLASAANEGPWTTACGQSASSSDVWYRFRTPDGCSGTLNVDTFGSSFDTVLEFYGFCGPPGIFGGGFACNDDCGGTFQSCLSYGSLAPGFELVIRVARYGGPTGNTGNTFTLNLSVPGPTNDHCSAALVIADGTHHFSTGCGATGALPMPASCGGGQPVNDLWFRYTAPITGRFKAKVCFPHPETIAVYPGDRCPEQAESAIACAWQFANSCNDDDIDLAVTAGQQVLVRLGGALIAGQTPSPIGAGTLTVSTSPSDPRDFNGDGDVNPDDLGDFINCFFGAPPCPGADFNGDGNIDPDDLGDFINIYFG